MIIRRNSMHCSLLSFLLEGKDGFCRVTAVSGLDRTWFSTSLNPCPSHILWCTEESLQGLSAFQQNLVHIHRSDHHALWIIIGMKGNDLDHLTTLVFVNEAERPLQTIYHLELWRNFGSARNHWPRRLIRLDWSCISSPGPSIAPTKCKQESWFLILRFGKAP